MATRTREWIQVRLVSSVELELLIHHLFTAIKPLDYEEDDDIVDDVRSASNLVDLFLKLTCIYRNYTNYW